MRISGATRGLELAPGSDGGMGGLLQRGHDLVRRERTGAGLGVAGISATVVVIAAAVVVTIAGTGGGRVVVPGPAGRFGSMVVAGLGMPTPLVGVTSLIVMVGRLVDMAGSVMVGRVVDMARSVMVGRVVPVPRRVVVVVGRSGGQSEARRVLFVPIGVVVAPTRAMSMGGLGLTGGSGLVRMASVARPVYFVAEAIVVAVTMVVRR